MLETTTAKVIGLIVFTALVLIAAFVIARLDSAIARPAEETGGESASTDGETSLPSAAPSSKQPSGSARRKHRHGR